LESLNSKFKPIVLRPQVVEELRLVAEWVEALPRQ